MLKFDDQMTRDFIALHEFDAISGQLKVACRELDQRTCPGSDYTGWLDLPNRDNQEELIRVQECAQRLREEVDYLVVIGIGGSYLGARAIIEALSHHFDAHLSEDQRSGPKIVFAGHQLSSDYLYDLIELLRGKRVAFNVISKSGTTTEPAVAFRVLRDALCRDVSEEIFRKRVIITTDRQRGALRRLADEHGLETFVIPDDVGGRFSVLTPVGLLPVATAGIDIDELLDGAASFRDQEAQEAEFLAKPAGRYAAVRTLLVRKGYTTEILGCYEPSMRMFTEWWKQLFGESACKDGRGAIPLGVDFTTDLHSLGQMIQEGPRKFFETIISFKKVHHEVTIPDDGTNLDQLQYLSGTPMSDVNDKAMLGTALAHVAGGVPNMSVTCEKRSAFALGELIYFFERACSLSCLMDTVNPFNQPGVEAYKSNMFALLGKPGHEERRAELERHIAERRIR